MKGAGHIDHPGTPVQVFGAVVLRTVNLFSRQDIQTDVLKQPEAYLNAINTGMLILNASLLFIIGLATFMWSGKLAAGLWLQAAPFLSPVILQFGLTRVSPEPMLFFVSSLIVLVVVFTLYRPQAFEKRPYQNILLWALVCGLGVAVKITFAPLVFIPLFIFTGIRKRLIYLGAAGAAFVIFTLPIIRMYPVFFRWVFNLLGHSGKYGGGKAGLPEAGEYFANAGRLFAGNWIFTVAIVLSLIVITVFLVKVEWRRKWIEARWFRLMTGVTAAQILGLLMVSKHSSSHYLLPVFNLTGVLMVLLYHAISRIRDSQKRVIFKKHMVTALFMILGVSIVLANPVGGILKGAKDLNHLKNQSLKIRAELEENYKDHAWIFYYRCSAPEYALKYGSDVSRSYHAKELEKLYVGSHIYFYDIWTKKFAGYDYHRNVPFETIRQRHDNQIVFMGSREFRFKGEIKGAKLKDVTKTRSYEGIFKIVPERSEMIESGKK